MPFTGYPDGNAAWLRDDSTVSVAYQSESYGPHFSWGAPEPETYPWRMKSGVSFTGSHIHVIDFERGLLSEYLNNKKWKIRKK